MQARTEMSGASQVVQWVKNPPANAGDTSRHKFDPWVRKILWRKARHPLQYSHLENPMDRGARWAPACRVAESDMTKVTEHAHARG